VVVADRVREPDVPWDPMLANEIVCGDLIVNDLVAVPASKVDVAGVDAVMLQEPGKTAFKTPAS
jgi:hypothetical protein